MVIPQSSDQLHQGPYSELSGSIITNELIIYFAKNKLIDI